MVVTATTLMITMTTPTAAITIVSVFCCAIIVGVGVVTTECA